MPGDVVSPGNKWFSNDLSENDTDRKKRSLVFEDGVLAREASWPWVVGITSSPRDNYCQVESVRREPFCGSDDIPYAEYEDILNQEDFVKETVMEILALTVQTVLDTVMRYKQPSPTCITNID